MPLTRLSGGRRLLPFAAVLMGLACVTACAPTANGPVEIMTIDRQASGGQFGPVAQTFSTLSDLTGLKGAAASFVGGARIIYDPNDPLLSTGGALTDTEEQRIVLKQSGQDVRLNYVRRNGVYWPVDFQSWQMATTYWNFELAYTYFNQYGIFGTNDSTSGQPTLVPTVYYYPYYQDATQSLVQEYDDTFYFPPVQGFVIEPNLYNADPTDPTAITTIPVSMNRGAMAIQYSRWIFNQIVYAGQSFPGCNVWGAPCPQSTTATPYPAYFYFEAFDQGLAIYHAWESLCTDGTPDTQCGDNTYLAPTYGSFLASELDVTDKSQCLTQTLKNEWTQQATGNNFLVNGDDKLVGAVIATALYQAELQVNQPSVMEAAVVASYFGSNANPGLFQLFDSYQSDPVDLQYGLLANAIVTAIPAGNDNLVTALCGQFLDRLGLTGTTLPACLNFSSNQTCPTLQ